MCNRSRARSPTPWLESPLQPPSFHPWSALASTSSSRHAPLSRRTKRWPPPSCGRRCLAPHHAGTGAPTPTHPSISDGPAPYRRRHGGHQLALHLPGLRAASPAQAGRPRPDIPCPLRTTGAHPSPRRRVWCRWTAFYSARSRGPSRRRAAAPRSTRRRPHRQQTSSSGGCSPPLLPVPVPVTAAPAPRSSSPSRVAPSRRRAAAWASASRERYRRPRSATSREHQAHRQERSELRIRYM